MSVMLGTPFAAFGAFLGLVPGASVEPGVRQQRLPQIGLVMWSASLPKTPSDRRVRQGSARAGWLGIVEAAMSAAEAAAEASSMTASRSVLGVLPLVRAAGAGREGRKVMGMTVFSGMLVAPSSASSSSPCSLSPSAGLSGESGRRRKTAPRTRTGAAGRAAAGGGSA